MSSAGDRARITAVVVTYNSAHCVEECLGSIDAQLRPHEIVVVDNASTDGSVAEVRRVAPSALVIEPGENLGFGRACNLGVAHSSGDTVMFVNPDVSISRANLDALGRCLLEPEQLGLLVPLLSETAGAAPRHQIRPYRPWRRVVRKQAWMHFRPRELSGSTRLARSPQNAWAVAALLFVRRSEFVELGGFDERYFLYGEDLDLSRRYREHGIGVRLTDSVVGHHAVSASSAPSEDTLRVGPLGWSILGTLEYLAKWEGPPVAARGAKTVMTALRVQRRLLDALNKTPGARGRARRKLRQVEQIRNMLLDVARDGGAPWSGVYYPGARAALRSVLGFGVG